jgi:dihydrolipoamide dehydrogenase
MSDKKSFDVVVIGGGPGGYVAAIRAAQLGLKTALVERDALGGVCLNWGCIPTKALLKAADTKRAIEHGAEFGVEAQITKIDFSRVVARSRDVAAQLSKGVTFLMKKHKIEVIYGTAVFAGLNDLEVTDKDGKKSTIGFAHAILATGARAKQIKGVLEADGKLIWTAKEAMVPAEQPKSLLIIGSGAIGVEFASFYNTFGTKVTIAEAQDRIVPVEDEEISKALKKALTDQGMEILTGAKVEDLKAGKDNVSVTINGEKKTYDRAILAIGVTGNTEGLNLPSLPPSHTGGKEKAGQIVVERGFIQVNDMYQTGVPHIYAIGDVAGAPCLAHVASHEGVITAEHIAFTMGKHKHQPHAMRYDNIPGCTYCTPQIGSTGLTEAAAKAAGKKVKVGKFGYNANGKAIAMGEDDGFVKTVFDAETGELLGAHIIGAEATEMISTFVLGRSMEAVEEDFYRACLPHPTLSEMLGEAVLASDGRQLNG